MKNRWKIKRSDGKKYFSMRGHFLIKSFMTNCLLLIAPILLIGPYSLMKISQESKSALEKSSYNVLHQVDETMQNLFGELDTIYYYIYSNPSVMSSLKVAFSEEEISLSTIRSTNNLCSILRHYIYSSDYITNMYVYYYGYDRVLVPQKGLVAQNTCNNAEWLQSLQDSESDIVLTTLEVSDNDYSAPRTVIYYCRQIYSSISPSSPIGVIALEYSVDALVDYIDTQGLYEEQTIAILGDQNAILLSNTDQELSAFLSDNEQADLGEFQYYDTKVNRKKYTVSQMQSEFFKDLKYMSIVPTQNVLQSLKQFEAVYMILTVGAILLSMALAVVKANRDYRRIQQIIDLLDCPEKVSTVPTEKASSLSDPYSFITYNILKLFVQQNYLRVQTSEQKYKLRALELTALQQQINPHFLHNTLNGIYWEAVGLTKCPNTCSEMISKLSAIMRYSLSNPEEPVSVEEELQHLQNYVYIQSQRFEQKLRVEYDVDQSATAYPIKKMLLQPLVENAISHGIKEKHESGLIRLRIHDREEYLYISIVDNGVGMTREKLTQLKESFLATEEYNMHVGLYNSHRRLILTYGRTAALHVCSHEGIGTCVFFRLPLSTEDKGRNRNLKKG